MLDFEFIIKIAEEKIEKIKSDEDLIKLNIEHGWLQNDPNKSKQIELARVIFFNRFPYSIKPIEQTGN